MGAEGADGLSDRPAQRPRWTRLAALGLALAGTGPLLMLAASLLWGLDAGTSLYFLAGVVVAFLGVFLLIRFAKAGPVAGIVAGVLLAGGFFWTAFSLSAPTSFFDFVPGVLVIPGAVLGIACSIAAIVARRRGHATERAEGGEGAGMRAAVGLAFVLTIASAVLSITSRSTVDATEVALTIRASDFAFDPKGPGVRPGDRILVRNDDPFLHTFTIDTLGIDETLTAGSEVLVTIPAATGRYVFFCRPHTTRPDDPTPGDMAGSLTVG